MLALAFSLVGWKNKPRQPSASISARGKLGFAAGSVVMRLIGF